MSDELLPYYERELTYIRHLAAQFADDHPKVAGRLRVGPESVDDPHVERLIEGFAYLTARIRRKLDDEFPEIVGSLLDVLYPHYQAPIPSMAIVQFRLDMEQAQVTSGHDIPVGAELETEPVQGEPVRFRTCYPVRLWPLEVRSAGLLQAPFPAPSVPLTAEAASVLRLVIGSPTGDVDLGELGMDSLRLFLRGQPMHVFRLYELIFNHALGVVLAASPQDPDPITLGTDCLRPVGFGREEGVLPSPPRSFLGYRLLTEYFTFPQKFLFVDLDLSAWRARGRGGASFEVYIFLDRALPDLARTVSAETFPLGCTPVVNLYRQRAEPISLTHSDFEYRVVPDVRLPLSHEVYSIDRVTAVPPRGEPVEYRPFFSMRHSEARPDRTYWHASRRASETAAAQGDRGTEVYLSLVDLAFRPSSPPSWTLDVETTCLSRDLPQKLPFSADQPRLQMREGGGVIARIRCLTPPTRTLRPSLGHGMLWRLVSHLTLNHLSIVNDPKAEALREILKLYDFADSAETRRQIEGVLWVTSRRVVGSIQDEGPIAVCRGVEVTVQFAEDRFPGGMLFLFASVLERFLALYCTINSFTKLIATVRGREGELRRWPPRIGERILA